MGISYENLPDQLLAQIFKLIPATQISSSCALVCRSWRRIAQDPILWQELCHGTGLRSLDAMHHLGGWKTLFELIYGTNLVASPCFERLHHMDAERVKARGARPFETKNRLVRDRIICSYELEQYEEEHLSFCYWSVDGGGSVFHRGGGDGIVREMPPLNCPPCPTTPNKPVIATSYEWGRLNQHVGLGQNFSNKFLDRSPPLLVSAWYAGASGIPASFRMQIMIRDEEKNPLYVWDSGDLWTKEEEWKQAKHLIQGYPSGMRSIVVKVAGTSIVPKKGYFGAKFTDIRLHFVPLSEVKNYETCVLGKVIYKS